MFCPKCGNQINDGSTFCSKCGSQISNNTASLAPSGAVAQKSKAPRNKKPFIIGGAAAVVVVVIAVIVYNVFFAPYAINEDRFPDPVVRSVMITQVDTDKDGSISRDEASRVIALEFDGAASVGGLNIFPNLQMVTLKGDILSSADLSGCASLKTITAPNCPVLTDLNIAASDALESIDISGDPVSSLDLSGKGSLASLLCENEVAIDHLDATPLHEYWVMSSFKSDSSVMPSAYTYDLQAAYDARGNLVKLYSDNEQYGSQTYNYEYDSLDRCVSMSTEGNYSETYTITYNDANQLTYASSKVNNSSYSNDLATEFTVVYNDRGLPTSSDFVVYQGGESINTMTYDENGNLIQVTEPNYGYTYSITNDEFGRMTGLTSTSTYYNDTLDTYSIAYDEAGRIVQLSKQSEYGNYSEAIQYDENGHMVNATLSNSPSIDPSMSRYSLADVTSTTFEYNEQGLLTRVAASTSGAGLSAAYSVSYKRLLVARDTAPNAQFVDLSNPLDPAFKEEFWNLDRYLYESNLIWQTSMKDILNKVAPFKVEEQPEQ